MCRRTHCWIVGERVVARRRSGDQAAVVTPVEANPGAPVKGQLILHVRGLVESFIMIDPEGQSRLSHCGPGSSNLRREEASGHRGHHDKRRDVMKVRHIGAQREARDLCIVPIDGKGDGSIAQNAEVECIMRVLPDVFAAEDDIFSESLLQSGVEFVAKARLQRSLTPRQSKRARATALRLRNPGWRARDFR